MEFVELAKMFAPEGVWAILSLVLIFYIIQAQAKRDLRQDERDKNYQDIILDLSEALKDLKDIKEMLYDTLGVK